MLMTAEDGGEGEGIQKVLNQTDIFAGCYLR